MSIWVYCIYHEQNIDLIEVKILVCIGVTKELNGRRGLRTTRITWLGFFFFFLREQQNLATRWEATSARALSVSSLTASVERWCSTWTCFEPTKAATPKSSVRLKERGLKMLPWLTSWWPQTQSGENVSHSAANVNAVANDANVSVAVNESYNGEEFTPDSI